LEGLQDLPEQDVGVVSGVGLSGAVGDRATVFATVRPDAGIRERCGESCVSAEMHRGGVDVVA
jgi:hypothetical protein